MKKRLLMLGAMALCLAQGAWAAEPQEVFSKQGMVSSAHELASQAGVEILKKGGNAIDAAVATALALNVVEFNASGIGGGGYMTIRFAKTGEVLTLDYRETAPAAVRKDMFASEESKAEKWSILGGKSVGVPGWLKGMDYALKTYGTMTFGEVAEPAIKLAEEGFVVAPMQNQIITDNFEGLAKYNDSDKLALFEEGLPIEAGKVLRQPDLAATFRSIALLGADKAFYNGPIGEAIVKAVAASGGSMTMDDLRNYKMYVRTPMTGTYRGYQIYSMPPSSSGGAHIVQLLNIMENFDVKTLGHNSPAMAHLWNEATKLVFADRSAYMADSDFVKLPLKGITSKDYAALMAKRITDEVAEEVKPGDPWAFDEGREVRIGGLGSERQSTSSFSVVDQQGNLVASTNTINYFCGSGVMVPDWGFLLNDEMDDFSSNPDSVNAPEPGKRPLSSMSPTIVLDPEGRPFMAVGAAGATRIITAISQIIMNVIDFDMPMDKAIEQGRLHNQSGVKLRVDQGRIAEELIRALTEKGYEVEEAAPGALGTAQCILFNHDKGLINGGADSRRLGVPVGF